MGRRKALDDDALHKYFYDNSDRHQQIRVHQLDLARSLLVDNWTLCVTIKRMIEAGHLRIVKSGKSGIKTYYVANPYGTDDNQKRQIKWQ